MLASPLYDAVVVGSGPNGLAAAITLAQQGCSVLVIEANDTLGGGVRSASLTQPGFTHDVCSSIYPFGIGSPFFQSLGLEAEGLEWIHPEAPLAHPLDDGSAALLRRSLVDTAAGLGNDGLSYRFLMEPFVEQWQNLVAEILQPVTHIPKHPLLLARFGMQALRSASGLARSRFENEPARALFAGLAAHSFLPLEAVASAAIGLVLGIMGHAVGWPMPAGGAEALTRALAARFQALGGKVQTGWRVKTLEELPSAHAVLLDVTPRQFLQIAGERLPSSYRNTLEKFRYGPGVFKLDYALSSPIPWKAPECAAAGTVHVGGTLEEIAQSESDAVADRHSERPFVLLAQHSLFDPLRAPEGKHTAWAYCHVPNGSEEDMTNRIEAQIERFAPGFRDCVLARHRMNTQRFEEGNANLVGGDIGGGVADWRQLVARPALRWTPYRTPLEGVYLCSSSTPPGGGVHGMCGYWAAKAALRRMRFTGR